MLLLMDIWAVCPVWLYIINKCLKCIITNDIDSLMFPVKTTIIDIVAIKYFLL